MNKPELQRLKRWFKAYTTPFLSGSQELQDGIKVKIGHILRVCREIAAIGRAQDLPEPDLMLAEACALFHDIGRFEQFARYGTYLDRVSENHALLGLEVMEKTGVLNGQDCEEVRLITDAVAFHNMAYVPEDLPVRSVFFIKMVRDADKLDIWRVCTDHYAHPEDERSRSILLGLPDGPEISDAICRDLTAGRIGLSSDIRTQNDFKLLQLGWVYDLNFSFTFEQVIKRGYLEKIRAALPGGEKIGDVYNAAKTFLESGAAG